MHSIQGQINQAPRHASISCDAVALTDCDALVVDGCRAGIGRLEVSLMVCCPLQQNCVPKSSRTTADVVEPRSWRIYSVRVLVSLHFL